MSTLDKRAHHNALERKRRDHIKDSFTGLRDAIPTMRGGDKSSRAQILKKASEYIQVIISFGVSYKNPNNYLCHIFQYMRRKNSLNQNDLDDLKRQNSHLEAQIRALERAKTAGNFSSAADILSDQGLLEEGESLPTDLGTSPAVRTAIAPGQSLLLTSPDNTADPPKKKVKQL